MRRTFDDLWIIDLEGDNLGARKTDNVFAIQTPVTIAIGVRYDLPNPDSSANIYYTKIVGTEEEKLAILGTIDQFDNLKWRDCSKEWGSPFLPASGNAYWDWPLLTDISPWQENGMQFKRSWPIAETEEVLKIRWKRLLLDKNRKKVFRETRDRKIHKTYPSLENSIVKDIAISNLQNDAVMPTFLRIAYRSFDRHWALVDSRLGDFLRPSMFRTHSNNQIYMTSLLTEVLGNGPAAIATSLMPDLHHFRGSFGGAHVIPLWWDTAGSLPNVTSGLLQLLTQNYGKLIEAEDLFAYCYAILGTPKYTDVFWDELTIPGPRIPITKDYKIFAKVSSLGRLLIYLHTYCERFIPHGVKPGKVPQGIARCKIGTPTNAIDYPNEYSYDHKTHELFIGKGIFNHVRPEIWEFSISGFKVVQSWLSYRMLDRKGGKSSRLDDIRPKTWQFDNELLDLLWVLDATVDLMPEVSTALIETLESNVFMAGDFPKPTAAERKGPLVGQMTLFSHGGLDP